MGLLDRKPQPEGGEGPSWAMGGGQSEAQRTRWNVDRDNEERGQRPKRAAAWGPHFGLQPDRE